MTYLTRPQIKRCMRTTAAKGFDPRNSHTAYAHQAQRAVADKARRERAPYPFHVIYR